MCVTLRIQGTEHLTVLDFLYAEAKFGTGSYALVSVSHECSGLPEARH